MAYLTNEDNNTGTKQTYYSIIKTDKNINSIPDKVENRIIVTKSGKVYFDYSDTERIELSGENKQYLTFSDFSKKTINTNVILKYDELTGSDNIATPDTVVVPSLVFDELGNIGIIIEKDDKSKKCKVLIVSLVTDYINKKFAKETNNEIVGNVLITSCCDIDDDDSEENRKAQIQTTKINTMTGQVTDFTTKIIGDNGIRVTTDVCKCDDSNTNALEMIIKLMLSKAEDNIIKVNDDGVFVPSVSDKVYSKEEVDELLLNAIKTKFDGPYDILEDVPKPYYYDYYYLIGTKAPYSIYVRIDCEWVLLGKSGINADDYYTKSEIDEKLQEITTRLETLETQVNGG